ncbi:hypothetical protein EVAR_38280_1 [Eumeta japonica]|uniref:Uncharacterized protein n=1 Tax=Eumeta variegata TaxID=151549 RepID=A0A4C1W9F7_EUMVA|nr:hypothetical protein EVAR_38280_1 [Eumeta japonica]
MAARGARAAGAAASPGRRGNLSKANLIVQPEPAGRERNLQVRQIPIELIKLVSCSRNGLGAIRPRVARTPATLLYAR